MNRHQSSKENNSSLPKALIDSIKQDSIVVRSPGRINLIGEHTDYNEGFVLPAAIDKAAYFVMTPGKDEHINLHSIDFGENYSTTTNELRKSEKQSWPNYILGVVEQFKEAGVKINGFDGAITGEIPLGAGLSSSAAVECAVAFALNEFTNSNFEKLQLVKMSQRAENEFVGVRCGIMDQFASVFGKRDHVIRLDCRSLDYEYEPFKMEGISIVLFDSGVKHSLASSEYNIRREQCERGVALIRSKYPEVKSLRDVSLKMLNENVQTIDPIVYRRCKYVIEENARLLKACEDLKSGNLKSFGEKMFATHDGLSKDYEVSCTELDFLVAAVRNHNEIIGARMMGGGFGGCTINIVKEDSVGNLINRVSAAFKQSMNNELKSYVVKIENGTSVLKSKL